MNTDLIADYQQRVAAATQKAAEQEKLINQYALLRLLVFTLFLIGIYFSVDAGSVALFLTITAVLAVAFNWLVRRQNVFERDKIYYESYRAVNQNELDNDAHRTNIYDNGARFTDDKHYYTADLDIYGKGSLFELINRAATPAGNRTLSLWLSAPDKKETILIAQEAVKELAGKNNWRLDMQARLLFVLGQDEQQIPRLLSYLKMPVAFDDEKWLRIYSRIVPFLSVGLLIAAVFFTEARYAAAVLLAINGRLVLSRNQIVEKADLIAGRIGKGLNSYAEVFKEIENETFTSVYGKQLAGMIHRDKGKPISYQVRALARLINNLNQRLNMFVSMVLNGLFIWNIRQVMAIEDWKRDNHHDIEQAFSAIAGFEAVISLAALQINNPDWAIPKIADGPNYTLTAKDIAHPLIRKSTRVANSYELNDTRKIDIITGSNMAGKSTFLRTLGINTVLALAGAPVCAQSMTVSVVQLFSYMRIKDSLNESTSTFKAELDRLQMLLKAVEQQPNIFFLIDEMLRGTNSVDKYLGSKAVIEKLIGQQGVGLVATHDLQLAKLEDEHPKYVRNFYFDIQVINGEMLFDYKLKPGECKTFNASLLLERIGIFASPPAP
ncbi:DNA mismatch repair protein MutS [Mucilaginibacter daejeonensis]|uniref:MutS-related protein n=1 Tax=Mucilaginibacter daejeonensis TaxID=398049 RepID=UPI001D17A3CD|nr:DNA mismatch repair protein MutS [Mucilaginibacter daejeonensis]UEG52546.1 DNA mismatch repair protein MutS [Mucilaginibacter daejeonensis]